MNGRKIARNRCNCKSQSKGLPYNEIADNDDDNDDDGNDDDDRD